MKQVYYRSDMARQIGSKSKQQCESHYMRFYVMKPLLPMEQLPEKGSSHFPSPVYFKSKLLFPLVLVFRNVGCNFQKQKLLLFLYAIQ